MDTEPKTRRTVDLASPLNQTIERGHAADFPVVLKPLYYGNDGTFQAVPQRFVVVREDTGRAVAVVSNR